MGTVSSPGRPPPGNNAIVNANLTDSGGGFAFAAFALHPRNCSSTPVRAEYRPGSLNSSRLKSAAVRLARRGGALQSDRTFAYLFQETADAGCHCHPVHVFLANSGPGPWLLNECVEA